MSELVEVEMTTNLFRASRMNGILIPDVGEVVELDEDSAQRLVAAKHAKRVGDDAEADETASVEAPEKAAAKPGRPRKVTV